MKTRALGVLLMVAAAGAYGVGCGSNSNNGGTGGAADAGTGGKGGAGSGGSGMGGKTDAGTDTGSSTGGKMDAGNDTVTSTGGKMDAGNDTVTSTGGKMDAGNDTPTGDAPADTQAAPTWTDVFAILSNVTTPNADTAPGCIHCHDGVIADGGQVRLPHSLNLADKTAAFAQLVGIDSLRCPAADGGAAVKRVLGNNALQSVLYQKLAQGVNMTPAACDGVAMPLNPLTPIDGGSADAGDGGAVDAGFVQLTHYMISSAQLATIMGWINAGAPNN